MRAVLTETAGSYQQPRKVLPGAKGSCANLPLVPRAIYCCKLANELLQAPSTEDSRLLRAIENALDSLQQPLKCTRIELDQLLLEASQLRRVGATRITTLIELNRTADSWTDRNIHLASACTRSIFAVTHFISRYIALKPSKKSTATSPQKSPKSLPVASIAQQSLKSTLAAVQINLVHAYVDWTLCVAALDSCLAISATLKDPCQKSSSETACVEKAPTTAIKVSNVYWSRYLRQKDTKACSADVLSALRKSIQALEGCTPSEMMTAFLAVKCERAATLYIEQDQIDRARQVLELGIDAHIQASTLSAVVQAALSECPRSLWGEVDSQQFMLGRLLSMHSRCFLQHQPSSSSFSFYDRTKLKAEERGLILEKQLIALSEMSMPKRNRSRVRELTGTVLSLYTDGAWSMHRLRLISRLLTFCSKLSIHPSQFLPETALNICRCISDGESFPSGKDHCSPHRSLRLSVLLQWEFQTGKPPLELLQGFVGCHSCLTSSCDFSAYDGDLLIIQSKSIIDFTDMYGLAQLKLDALLLLRRFLELQSDTDVAALSSCTSQIGLQLTRMGYTRKAGRTLAIAETFLSKSKSKTLIALQWHLAYAEYLLALSSCEKAADQLASARCRYESDFSSDIENGSQSTRLAQLKFLAQASYVASKLALEKGDLDAAILHAKKSVKISGRQWALLEKLISLGLRSHESSSDVEVITDGLSTMTLSAENRPTHTLSKGAAFWAYVYPHFIGLIHLSQLAAHCGSSQDGVYYAEQAKKVGEAVDSDVFLCTASCVLAQQLAQAGDSSGSQLVMDDAQNCWKSMGDSADSLPVLIVMAKARLGRLESSQMSEVVEQARAAILKIQASDDACEQSAVEIEHSSGPKPTAKVSRPGHSTARNPAKPRSIADSARKRAVRADGQGVSLHDAIAAPAASLWLQRIQSELGLFLSCLHLRLGSTEESKDTLSRIQYLARSLDNDVWHYAQQGSLMLAEATRLLQSNAVYSVLPESTIAYPSRNHWRGVDVQNGHGERMGPMSSALAGTLVDKPSTRKKPASEQRLSRAGEIVSQARELMLAHLSSTQPISASKAANEFSGVLIRLELLSSILSSAVNPNPHLFAGHLNAPKSLRWSRETASLHADLVLSEKSSVFSWPDTNDAGKSTAVGPISAVHDMTLEPQLSRALPASWVVVTVALSDDQTEMYLSKIRSGQSPFLLRLPLHRPSSEDIDEDPFEFRVAKEELLDIIAKANLTSHDTKDRSDKKGKKEWWIARKALDERLMSLLKNVEALWLGGFRGILSNRHVDLHQLCRFSGSLSRILDQHLPSRRKTTAKTKPRTQLHSHVAELFVALGNPDDKDLDDCITDLIYFVIDVLQFQGELNAYDEIDTDVMVMEITDALRSYHDATNTAWEQKGHTILILDKALHSLPWESLPCLQGQSVSRIPSLNCLHSLVLRMNEDNPASPGLAIDVGRGTYILNPSSDLTSTQEMFLEPFRSSLANYTSIVNRAPTESEFQSCLQDHELCLYFGHGSGGQFIRGRTIKRLKHCAVTFLMGCSSSKMVESGQFEPYGTPYNYLQAGSAAVVGTLWDVTDKDIDRFAMDTFVNWGLLGRDAGGARSSRHDSKSKTPKRNMERKKRDVDAREQLAEGTAVGLDDAVAQARDACLLRYLNGAAPVIYGIPVYLNRQMAS